MLSADQIAVLDKISQLSASALLPADQRPLVQSVCELLQSVQDDVEYEELTNASHTNSSYNQLPFVKLCRQKLIEAQHQSLANFNILRKTKTKKLDTAYLQNGQSDNTANIEPIETGDDLQQSLREAKSESISQVLQRMHEMATTEILKSEMNISELDLSSKTLRELQEKYSGVDILLNGSRKLVKILDEADKWDRRCMLASLGFLAAVMCYIIYRRILSGPVRFVLWALFKLVGLARLFGFTTSDDNSLAKPSIVNTAPPTTIFGGEVEPSLHQATSLSEHMIHITENIPSEVTTLLENTSSSDQAEQERRAEQEYLIESDHQAEQEHLVEADHQIAFDHQVASDLQSELDHQDYGEVEAEWLEPEKVETYLQANHEPEPVHQEL